MALPEVEAIRDAAQAIVTAFVHGDRCTAADIIAEHHGSELTLLAGALGDLAAYTNRRWGEATEVPPIEAWRTLMLDINEWRAGIGS
jgi:hypothetical protein